MLVETCWNAYPALQSRLNMKRRRCWHSYCQRRITENYFGELSAMTERSDGRMRIPASCSCGCQGSMELHRQTFAPAMSEDAYAGTENYADRLIETSVLNA